MEVNYRRIIQLELNLASELRKPIIVIARRGAQRLPKPLLEMATDVVGWNRNSIIKDVRKYAL
jgi:hypothetical protein